MDESYTVKSAYSQCMSLADEISPNLVGPDRNWSSLWKLPVPHKVRSFLWRAAHRCLPTRTRLIHKGVQCEETCVNCDALAETHIHIFFVALFNNNSNTGYGFCFRDSNGQFVTVLSNFEPSSSSPAEAEALGLLKAVQFAIDKNMVSVVFESDCKVCCGHDQFCYSPPQQNRRHYF